MKGCPSSYVTTQVLSQFLLKTNNWPVMTCIDLWPVLPSEPIKKSILVEVSSSHIKTWTTKKNIGHKSIV